MRCIVCSKEISINRISKHYCTNRCREDSNGRVMSVIRAVKKHTLNPIYQAKQLGLFSIQRTRRNSKPCNVVIEYI